MVLDGSTQFSTSTQVNGKVYAADYGVPTPAYMTAAILAMQAAYTAASAPATPAATDANHLNVGAGTLAGNTFTAGVYTWSSNVQVADDITLAGTANAVFVFQVTGTLVVSSGVTVRLTGGVQATNVYWQVSGATTLGSMSHFVGTILDATSITMQTGASVTGRLLAQTVVTLERNKISPTANATTTAPFLGVAANFTILAEV